MLRDVYQKVVKVNGVNGFRKNEWVRGTGRGLECTKKS